MKRMSAPLPCIRVAQVWRIKWQLPARSMSTFLMNRMTMRECQQIMPRPLKILFDPHSATDGKPLFNQDEANGYETGKFDRHNNTLIPAHALVRWWTKHSRHRRRLRARDLRAQFP